MSKAVMTAWRIIRPSGPSCGSEYKDNDQPLSGARPRSATQEAVLGWQAEGARQAACAVPELRKATPWVDGVKPRKRSIRGQQLSPHSPCFHCAGLTLD